MCSLTVFFSRRNLDGVSILKHDFKVKLNVIEPVGYRRCFYLILQVVIYQVSNVRTGQIGKDV